MAISGQISGIPDSHSAGSSAPGQRVHSHGNLRPDLRDSRLTFSRVLSTRAKGTNKDSNLLSNALFSGQSGNQGSSSSFALVTGDLCRAGSKEGGKGGEGKHAETC